MAVGFDKGVCSWAESRSPCSENMHASSKFELRQSLEGGKRCVPMKKQNQFADSLQALIRPINVAVEPYSVKYSHSVREGALGLAMNFLVFCRPISFILHSIINNIISDKKNNKQHNRPKYNENVFI